MTITNEAVVNVFAFEDHTITCKFDDIPAQIDDITWSPATETNGKYSLDDGKIASKSQTAELTITTAELTFLHDAANSGPSHTFTCSYTFGSTTTKKVEVPHTITIFNPSKYDSLNQ